MQITRLRELFPITGSCVYLNHAAEAPLNERSRTRLDEYFKHMSLSPQDKPGGRSRIRNKLSELMGGSADEYALVNSTGIGLGIVAAGITWAQGDNVVVPLDEHWNNTYPWLNLARHGVEVRVVEPDEHFRITPESIAEHVDERTKAVAIAAVRFNSGFRADLRAVGQIAHKHGAILVVDG
ncbi:MAG TPA: aminotransferase class V-fold PLP-dependent enzyme, partial [Bacillota bacterium]|nr:aminotransferase class V-fold PLP-dependent enzyme [Bacillota bacterium]